MKKVQKGVLFSKELVNKLKEAWQLGKKIKITGVNYYGVEFSTGGKITTDDNGKPGIHDYNDIMSMLYVEFGKTKFSPDALRTRFYAPFKTKISDDFNSLVILTLEIDGDIVFENPNSKNVVQEAKKHKKDLIKKFDENSTTYPDCPVVREINKLVGKPIILNGEKGVLVSVGEVSVHGYPIVHIMLGGYCCSLQIHEESVLETELEDGTQVVLAKNAPEEFKQALLNASSKAHADTI